MTTEQYLQLMKDQEAYLDFIKTIDITNSWAYCPTKR